MVIGTKYGIAHWHVAVMIHGSGPQIQEFAIDPANRKPAFIVISPMMVYVMAISSMRRAPSGGASRRPGFGGVARRKRSSQNIESDGGKALLPSEKVVACVSKRRMRGGLTGYMLQRRFYA